ncbi:hypothetical protein ACFXP3_24205 [Streptomyces sp. NPDC059096]|uniref:hypothetical protein n=1 Tax=Streptomyces sp. NPDC059096 TaxID=3346727 RepID=UPI0036C63CCB
MDLQGVAAVAAAVVAGVGIPSTLLISRWQLRAALKAADSTHHAGLAQAEATYKAAVDAVRAQSDSAHDHWRRGVRREACSVFLLAAEEVTGLAEEMLDGSGVGQDLVSTRRALKRALVVLELEGPGPLVEAAGEVKACCDELVSLATDDGYTARVWRSFYAVVEAERGATARMEQLTTPAHDALVALSSLQQRLDSVRRAHTEVVRPVRAGLIEALPGYLPRTDELLADPQVAYEALERCHMRAVSCLREHLGMPEEEAEVLLRGTMNDGRTAMLDHMAGEYTRLEEARRAFLSVARHTLDGELPDLRPTAQSDPLVGRLAHTPEW